MSEQISNAAKPRKVDIGLDIGIASVGWALVDSESLEIIKHGVRLFDPLDDERGELANVVRRTKRSMRRQIRRRQTLRRDFVALLVRSNLVDLKIDPEGVFVNEFTAKHVNNPQVQKALTETYGPNYLFELRKSGLKGALKSQEELFAVLYWYMHNHGYRYTEAPASEKESAQAKSDYQKAGAEYNVLKKDLEYPVLVQEAIYARHGSFRGEFNRHVSTHDYEKELKAILANQKHLDESFKAAYLALFERGRSYEKGPGNEKSKTRFGVWYTVDKEKGELVKREQPLQSLWEQTEGFCSVFPTERRAPKNSMAAEVFNLLSDLNNLRFTQKVEGSRRVDLAVKKAAINKAMAVKSSSKAVVKVILEHYELKDEKELVGRQDKEKSLLTTPLTSFHKINDCLTEAHKLKYSDFFDSEGNYNFNNLVDQAAGILHKTQIVEERIALLNPSDKAAVSDPRYAAAKAIVKSLNLSLEEITRIANLAGFSQTHSFSFKALAEFIPQLLKEPGLNQQQIIAREEANPRFKKDLSKYAFQGKLSKTWIEELVAAPTIKRGLRQAVLVLNALFDLIKEHSYALEAIVVEMAREQNNKQRKERISEQQKYFENLNKTIADKIGQFGKDVNKVPAKLRDMVWLHDQQMGRDAYTGDIISLNEVVNRSEDFDVDHVIPRSFSNDNSRSNLVLTRKTVNSQKAQRSPFMWDPQVVAHMRPFWEKWYTVRTKKDDARFPFYDKTKYNFLVDETDFSNPANQVGFLNRNLVDTRYITRSLYNVLENYAKVGKLGYVVRPVNGKMTSYARSQIDTRNNPLLRPEGIPSRDEKGKKLRVWHGHHAEDAYMVVVLNAHFKSHKGIEAILSHPGVNLAYNETFEDDLSAAEKAAKLERTRSLQAKLVSNNAPLHADFDKAREELNSKMDSVKFSRMVVTKNNVPLFNETLYRAKATSDPTKVTKITRLTLADMDSATCERYFGDNPPDKEKLLMCKKDSSGKVTCHSDYEQLNAIYKQNVYKSKEGKAGTEKVKYPFKEELTNIGLSYLPLKYQSERGKWVNRRVEKISVAKEDKNIDDIIVAPNNGGSFYDSLDWVQLNIYEDKKGKLQVLKIEASNAKFEVDDVGKSVVKLKEDVLKIQKVQLGIYPEKNPKGVLKKNDVLVSPNNDEYVFVSGVDQSTNRIDIKYLQRGKLDGESPSHHRSLNKALKGWKQVKMSVLGDILEENQLF